ncbi:MAG: class I SAM-dependent methyltransferase [Candidatus Hodarchaeota archaeon]
MEEIRERAKGLNEGTFVQEARYCLLCGSEGMFLYRHLRDRHFSVPGIWALMRCPKCRLVWLNPRPIPKAIGRLYEHYFTHENSHSIVGATSLRSIVRNTILGANLGYKDLVREPWKKHMGKVLSWIKPIREMAEYSVMTLEASEKGKLLDIGCGSGQFLAKMKDLGWEVTGVEPDKQAVKVARERFGLCVRQGMLEDHGFPNDTFQAITMNHVIEHLCDPIGTLQECERLLRPNGKLIIVTPNIESLESRLSGKTWLHLDPPRHLYLFSPRTLFACAERAKLRILVLKTTARTARGVYVASDMIRRHGVLPGASPQKVGLWLQLKGLTFQAVEHGLCYLTGIGEELVLIATR